MKRQEWLEAIKPVSVGDDVVYIYSAPQMTCLRCERVERVFKTFRGKVTAIDRDGITIKQLHGAFVEKRYSYRMAMQLEKWDDHRTWEWK